MHMHVNINMTIGMNLHLLIRITINVNKHTLKSTHARIQEKHQMTRGASEEKWGLKEVHRQRRPCCFEKELAEGHLYRIQEKHQMTRGEPEEKRRLRQKRRQRQACVLKKSWPKASSTEYKRSIR